MKNINAQQIKQILTEEVDFNMYSYIPELLAPRVQEDYRKVENKNDWYNNDELYLTALNAEYDRNHPDENRTCNQDDYFWGVYSNDYPEADALFAQLKEFTIQALMLVYAKLNEEIDYKVLAEALLQVGMTEELLQGTPFEFAYKEQWEEYFALTLVEAFALNMANMYVDVIAGMIE